MSKTGNGNAPVLSLPQILHLRKKGYDNEEIAKMNGTSRQRVYQFLKKHGHGGKVDKTARIAYDVWKLRNEGKTRLQIAAILDVSQTFINNTLRKHKIPPPKSKISFTAEQLEKIVKWIKGGYSDVEVGQKIGLPCHWIRKVRVEQLNIHKAHFHWIEDTKALRDQGLRPTEIANRLNKSQPCISYRLKKLKELGI